MKVSDFTFDLPEELIAQDPLEDRSSSRLLTLDKNTGEIGHDVFHNIVNYLKPGDCLVLNNTKVIPARLIGAKEETGGKVEVLLLKRKQDNVWETLVKPGKKARPGARISFGDGKLVGEVIDVVDEGNRLVKFEYEGILVKRALNRIEKYGNVLLKSDNRIYGTKTFTPEEIKEVWEVKLYLSFNIPDPATIYDRMNDLEADIFELREQLKRKN